MIRPWILRNAGATRQYYYRHPQQFQILNQAFRNINNSTCLVTSTVNSTVSRTSLRLLQTNATTTTAEPAPLRKRLKDEAKALKKSKGLQHQGSDASSQQHADWELTVGVEIHAQLNTGTKLFSRAATSNNNTPNSNVALFDLAFPGAQPEFQIPTLLPALRAAIALNCDIQPISRFDRKHYFYQDQPAGYQITQYYEPFARNGYVDLFEYDGIAPEDGPRVRIDIKQIQLEQDTAKSQEYPPSIQLLDFNRVSHPLVEIITMPQIHSPTTAAACVRKIQSILQATSSVTTGMELGGLRADINVSVRKRSEGPGPNQYSGMAGLGQRTEIKNLSSFKAVEDAIIAERNRQIGLLERGGTVEGETRAWSIGATETRRLRGKEGEVDYRYMPDPDLGPLIVDDGLIAAMKETLPTLPDEWIALLVSTAHGLSVEDAKVLVELDHGVRLEYYFDVLEQLQVLQQDHKHSPQPSLGKITGNWVLHEVGGLLTKMETTWDSMSIPADTLADIIDHLLRKEITGATAKKVLAMVFEGDSRDIRRLLTEENLLLRPLSREEYLALARMAVSMKPEMVTQIRDKNQLGKLGWFVGQMMRLGVQGRVEAQKAEEILREVIFKDP